jgi:hypothetical protein
MKQTQHEINIELSTASVERLIILPWVVEWTEEFVLGGIMGEGNVTAFNIR